MNVEDLSPEQRVLFKQRVLQKHWENSLDNLDVFIWGDGKRPGFIVTMDEADQTNTPRKRFPDRSCMRVVFWLYQNYKKLDILKSRQLMITWFMCAACLHMCMKPGKKIFVFAKKEKGSNANIQRIYELYRLLPEHLRPDLDKTASTLTFRHDDGDSMIIGATSESSDPRQYTFSMIWVDESAFADAAKATVESALPTIQSGGRVILTTTPNGQEYSYQVATDMGRIPHSELHRPFDGVDPEYYPMDLMVNSLSNEPQIIHRGMKAWKNLNGWACLLMHFTADPESADEELRRDGYSDEQAFQREHHLDFASFAGTPVFATTYVAEKSEKPHIEPISNIPLWLSWDFGRRHPAVTIHQFPGQGKWHKLGEIHGEGLWLGDYITDRVIPYLRRRFPEWLDGQSRHLLLHAADIAGNQKTANSPYTAFQIMQRYDFFPRAKKQSIGEGLDLMMAAMARTRDGEPGFLVDKSNCPTSVEAYRMGYRYDEARANRAEPEKPLKDGTYDHWVDTDRYVAVQNLSMLKKQPLPVQPEKTFAERALESVYGNEEYFEWL